MISHHFVRTNLRPAASLTRAVSPAAACAGLILLLSGSAIAETKIEKDATPVTPGTISYTVTSDYQQGPNKLEVLLPDKLEPGKKYPVLYTLPVNVGTSGNWGSAIVELKKLDVQNRYGVIVVAPAYDIDPWFGDTPKPEDPSKPWIRQQGYVLDVVIPFLDKEFPTLAEKSGRYLIGFSKSGFGAFGLILRNPGVFAKAAVYDCADPTPPEKIFLTWGMTLSYGPLANFDRNFNIVRLLKTEEVVKPLLGESRRITLMAGNLHYGGVEAIHQALQDSKIPYTYVVFPGMGHAWSAGWLGMAANSILPEPSKP